jgi:hypothetical protein
MNNSTEIQSMDLILRLTKHILRNGMGQIELTSINENKDEKHLGSFRDDIILLPGVKRHQLIGQVVFKAMIYFTIGIWEKKGGKVAGDLRHDLIDEDRTRKLYETLIQDSRRR